MESRNDRILTGSFFALHLPRVRLNTHGSAKVGGARVVLVVQAQALCQRIFVTCSLFWSGFASMCLTVLAGCPRWRRCIKWLWERRLLGWESQCRRVPHKFDPVLPRLPLRQGLSTTKSCQATGASCYETSRVFLQQLPAAPCMIVVIRQCRISDASCNTVERKV